MCVYSINRLATTHLHVNSVKEHLTWSKCHMCRIRAHGTKCKHANFTHLVFPSHTHTDGSPVTRHEFALPVYNTQLHAAENSDNTPHTAAGKVVGDTTCWTFIPLFTCACPWQKKLKQYFHTKLKIPVLYDKSANNALMQLHYMALSKLLSLGFQYLVHKKILFAYITVQKQKNKTHLGEGGDNLLPLSTSCTEMQH